MEYVNQTKWWSRQKVNQVGSSHIFWFRKCLNQLGSHQKGLQRSFSLFVMRNTFLFIKYAFDHTHKILNRLSLLRRWESRGEDEKTWFSSEIFLAEQRRHSLADLFATKSVASVAQQKAKEVWRRQMLIGINWIKQLPPSLPLLFNTTLQISDYRFFYFLAGRVGGSLYLSCGRH